MPQPHRRPHAADGQRARHERQHDERAADAAIRQGPIAHADNEERGKPDRPGDGADRMAGQQQPRVDGDAGGGFGGALLALTRRTVPPEQHIPGNQEQGEGDDERPLRAEPAHIQAIAGDELGRREAIHRQDGEQGLEQIQRPLEHDEAARRVAAQVQDVQAEIRADRELEQDDEKGLGKSLHAASMCLWRTLRDVDACAPARPDYTAHAGVNHRGSGAYVA